MGDLTEGFCVTGLGGLCLEGPIHAGAYFRNFPVISIRLPPLLQVGSSGSTFVFALIFMFHSIWWQLLPLEFC